jgi:hypothetical protein
MDASPGLVGLGARHHAERDLAGAQRRHPCLAGQLEAFGRQDRRYADEVLLLDVRIPQRQLESSEAVAMHADAAREEIAGRNRKHAASFNRMGSPQVPEPARFVNGSRREWRTASVWPQSIATTMTTE